MGRSTGARAVIIGAGLGGLAVASRLAHAGYEVRVFEKEEEVGGRLGRMESGGFRWDIGPTILLFPEVLRSLFREVGFDPDAELDLVRCDPNYRVHYRDASSITLMRDRALLTKELERFSPGSSTGFFEFLRSADEKKRIAFDTFLSEPFSHVKDMTKPRILRGLVSSESYRSVAKVAEHHVEDARLRMALTFQTMYLGLSPFAAPALFGLLPNTEFDEGIWYARGGLAKIALAVREVAEKLGARIECGRGVRTIEGERGRATGVVLDDGAVIEADIVIANADLPYVYRKLLKRPLLRPLSYTSSALIFMLGANRQWDDLLHHNVFFGGAYKESFEQLFHRHEVPDDPSFYVAEPSRTDPSVAPSGGSSLYVLLPVPHLHPKGPNWLDPNRIEQLRTHVLERLEKTVAPGLRGAIVTEKVLTPLDWNARFSLEHGSAFGLAHTLDQVAALRPSQQDSRWKNLFFVGASTQPATGIPNILIGAKQVVGRVLAA